MSKQAALREAVKTSKEEKIEQPIDNIGALSKARQASGHKPYMVTVHIEGKPLDTGACVSIVNHKLYKKLCTKKLKPSQTKL